MGYWICPYCGREPFETPGPPQPTCCDEMLAQWRDDPPDGEYRRVRHSSEVENDLSN